MKKTTKLPSLIINGFLIGGLFLTSCSNSQDEKFYKETMEEIDAAFERAKVQPDYETNQTSDINTQVDESETPSQGSGGPTRQYSEEVEEPKKQYSKETKEYFNEIALKTEFDGDRDKVSIWTTDMKIYVDGEKPDYLISELNKIVMELNDLIDPITIRVVNRKQDANYIIYFGTHIDFKNKYKLSSPQRLDTNWGYFQVNTNSGKMYVDLYRNDDELSHRHLLREELTQSLGLFNDSYKYPESIFYQGWTRTTEYAPIDRELIDMLYN